jgi:hypothetical protein
MPMSPFDRDVTEPPRDGRAEPRRDAEPTPEMRASPRDDDDDQRAGETIDEPGYGHGV